MVVDRYIAIIALSTFIPSLKFRDNSFYINQIMDQVVAENPPPAADPRGTAPTRTARFRERITQFSQLVRDTPPNTFTPNEAAPIAGLATRIVAEYPHMSHTQLSTMTTPFPSLTDTIALAAALASMPINRSTTPTTVGTRNTSSFFRLGELTNTYESIDGATTVLIRDIYALADFVTGAPLDPEIIARIRAAAMRIYTMGMSTPFDAQRCTNVTIRFDVCMTIVRTLAFWPVYRE
jgi:hypothetical protein